MPTIEPVSDASDQRKICVQCGHPDGDHLMHADMPYPTEGWITCPVSGCECYGTWSVNEESRATLEQCRAEHFQELDP